MPETITIDGSEANAAAIRGYNEEHGTAIILRQVKYLNNVVEQDHRAVKRVTRPMLGFKSFDTAQGTLAGVELMHMMGVFAYPPGTVHSKDDAIGIRSGVTETGQHWNEYRYLKVQALTLPIPPLPLGEGGVRAQQSQGDGLWFLDCHTLI